MKRKRWLVGEDSAPTDEPMLFWREQVSTQPRVRSSSALGALCLSAFLHRMVQHEGPHQVRSKVLYKH